MPLEKARGGQNEPELTAGTKHQGNGSRMKVMIVKEMMWDRVAMPRVETLWEKTALQANAQKVTLPKTRVTRNVEIGPTEPRANR